MDEEPRSFRTFLIAGICVAISLLLGFAIDTLTAGFVNMWLMTALLSAASITAAIFYGRAGADDDEFLP